MRLAIIVGHSEEKKGSKSFTGEYEYDFNSRIARKLLSRFIDVDIEAARIFYRTGSRVKEVGENVTRYNPDAVIELHCNSYSKPIRGKVCEALAAYKDKESIEFAKVFSRNMNAMFGFGLRHKEGYKQVKPGQRGSFNLTSIKLDVPKIIVEPCFWNFETNESKLFMNNEDAYVEVLANTFFDMLDVIFPVVKVKQCQYDIM